jgi:hypothetical protein
MSLLFSPVYSPTHLLQLLSFLCESGPPPSPVALSTGQPQLQAFPSPRFLGGCLRSCLLWLACLFTVCLRDCSSPTLWAWGLLPSLLHVLFFDYSAACLLFSFSFSFSFPLGGGQSVQGGMLIWPRVVFGSTACRLAHLVVCVFPSSLGASVWRLRSPFGFSIYHGVGMLCARWGCGGVGVLPLLGGFSYKVYLQRLSKILL